MMKRYQITGFLAVVAVLSLSTAAPGAAQPKQLTFASPEEAAKAFYLAVKKRDGRKVWAILGVVCKIVGLVR